MTGLKPDLPMPGSYLLSEVKGGKEAGLSKKGKSVAANAGLSTSFDEALRGEMGGTGKGGKCGKGTHLSPDQKKRGPSQENAEKGVSGEKGLPIVMASPAFLGKSTEAIESHDKTEQLSVDPTVRALKFSAMKTESEKAGAPGWVKEIKTGSGGDEGVKVQTLPGDVRLSGSEKKGLGPSPSGEFFQKVLKESAASPLQNTPDRKLSPSAGQEKTASALRDGVASKKAEPSHNGPAVPVREKGKEPEGLKNLSAARIPSGQEEHPKGTVSPGPQNAKEAGTNDSSAKERTRKEGRLEGKAVAEGPSSTPRGDDSKIQRAPAHGGDSGNGAGEKENAWKTTFLSAGGGNIEDAERLKEKISSKEQTVTKSGKTAVSEERLDSLSGIRDSGDQKVSDFRIAKSPASEAPTTQNLFERIADNGEMLVRTGQNRVRLTLTPPQLGTLDIDLVVKSDQVRMVLTAENTDVCHVLQSNLDQLKTVLQGQGFDIDRMDVFVQDRGERENGMSRGEMSFGREHSGNRGDDGPREEPLAALSHRSYRDLFRGEEGISIFA